MCLFESQVNPFDAEYRKNMLAEVGIEELDGLYIFILNIFGTPQIRINR
jgi:hypothetical protein